MASVDPALFAQSQEYVSPTEPQNPQMATAPSRDAHPKFPALPGGGQEEAGPSSAQTEHGTGLATGDASDNPLTEIPANDSMNRRHWLMGINHRLGSGSRNSRKRCRQFVRNECAKHGLKLDRPFDSYDESEINRFIENISATADATYLLDKGLTRDLVRILCDQEVQIQERKRERELQQESGTEPKRRKGVTGKEPGTKENEITPAVKREATCANNSDILIESADTASKPGTNPTVATCFNLFQIDFKSITIYVPYGISYENFKVVLGLKDLTLAPGDELFYEPHVNGHQTPALGRLMSEDDFLRMMASNLKLGVILHAIPAPTLSNVQGGASTHCDDLGTFMAAPHSMGLEQKLNADENNDIGDGSLEYYRGATATDTGKGKVVAGASQVNSPKHG